MLPGFVNTHAHSHSSLTRGSAEGLPLEGWLAVIEKEQARLTDEQAYIGALATYAEALLSGTTTIVDMCMRPEPAMAAARDIGIRAIIVPYVADTKPFAPTWSTMRGCSRPTTGWPRALWVGLHDLESCSDELHPRRRRACAHPPHRAAPALLGDAGLGRAHGARVGRTPDRPSG